MIDKSGPASVLYITGLQPEPSILAGTALGACKTKQNGGKTSLTLSAISISHNALKQEQPDIVEP